MKNPLANIGCIVLTLAVFLPLVATGQQQKSQPQLPMHLDATQRYAWPSLGMDKTIALGEALQSLPSKTRVVIWCPGLDCLALQSDLDDAFQIANWDSDFDRRRVDSNDDTGLFVGPRGERADRLAAAIEKATGIHVELVDAPSLQIETINLYIGKRPH
jgi:hypothetical protein